jgi:hypothetical protein
MSRVTAQAFPFVQRKRRGAKASKTINPPKLER